METLSVSFENCYGIKKLDHVFDFSQDNAHVIYAPNGAMKSSFAKIFDDLSKGQLPKDRVFKKRTTIANVKINEIGDLDSQAIFVIERYKENFSSEKISTLLVNSILRERYQEILTEIDGKKDALIKQLQVNSGLKNDLTVEFTKSFNMSEKDLLPCLELLSHIVNDGVEQTLANISYKEVFNDKVIDFLSTKNFKSKLDDYMSVYDQLVSNSTYFKKGVFNHNNADTVSKTLKSNGFFDASHSVSLNRGEGRKEVLTQEELDNEINSEKSKILKDDDLVKKFKAIDDAITKNVSLKDFRTYLVNNPIILTEIDDLSEFKKKIWCAYLKSNIDSYNELLNLYRQGKLEIEGIVDQAKKEETSWQDVVQIFNQRFSVPYKVLVKNQDDVILKGVSPNMRNDFREYLRKIWLGKRSRIFYGT